MTYIVAKRNGTAEEEFSDTIFIVGAEDKVCEWIDKNGEAGILQTGFESLRAAEKWFVRNWGAYNNFDYKSITIED